MQKEDQLLELLQQSDTFTFFAGLAYRLFILALLWRIGSAIYEQTRWLKGDDEIDQIGDNLN